MTDLTAIDTLLDPRAETFGDEVHGKPASGASAKSPHPIPAIGR